MMEPHSIVTLAVSLVVGAGAGVGSGRLGIAIEKFERLAESEAEERALFEKEVAAERARDEEKGKVKKHYQEWFVESYGVTWLEKWASPIAMALAWGAISWFSLNDLELLLIQLCWATFLVHFAIFDIKHRLVLDIVSYPAIVLSIVLSFFTPTLLWPYALAGGALVSFFFLFPALVAKGSVGLGDVKLGFFIGAITGFWILPTVYGAVDALFWGVFTGGIASLVVLVWRRRGGKDTIAYAPYLCLGAIIAIVLTHY